MFFTLDGEYLELPEEMVEANTVTMFKRFLNSYLDRKGLRVAIIRRTSMFYVSNLDNVTERGRFCAVVFYD